MQALAAEARRRSESQARSGFQVSKAGARPSVRPVQEEGVATNPRPCTLATQIAACSCGSWASIHMRTRAELT